MSTNQNIPKVRPGEKISAKHTNRIVSLVNRNVSANRKFVNGVGEVPHQTPAQKRRKHDFPARLTHTTVSDLNEVTEGKEWTYPWRAQTPGWDATDKRVTLTDAPEAQSSKELSGETWVETDERKATDLSNELDPDDLENHWKDAQTGWYPAPETGESETEGRMQRGPWPPNTRVMMREVTIDGTPRYFIVGVMWPNARPLCGAAEAEE